MTKPESRVPIKLRPEPVERVWGGQAVKRKFGWTPPEGKTIGEWWTLSFRHDHPSVVADGDINLSDFLGVGGIRAGLNLMYGTSMWGPGWGWWGAPISC